MIWRTVFAFALTVTFASSAWAQESVATKKDNAASNAAETCKALHKLLNDYNHKYQSHQVKIKPWAESLAPGQPSILGMMCYGLQQVRLQMANPLTADEATTLECGGLYAQGLCEWMHPAA
jgi:hypothetical protein